jgi:hypothetical protein
MQNLLPSFLDEEEASLGGRTSGGKDAAAPPKKSWDPEISRGDSLVKLPRYLVDNSQDVDGTLFVPIRQDPIVKMKSVPILPSAPPNLRYLPIAPDSSPSPLSINERLLLQFVLFA